MIRLVNELLACKWALQKIDNTRLDKLDENLQTAKTGFLQNQPEIFLKYDEEFHEIIFQVAGSQHLLEICQQLRCSFYAFILFSLPYKVERLMPRILASSECFPASCFGSVLSAHLV